MNENLKPFPVPCGCISRYIEDLERSQDPARLVDFSASCASISSVINAESLELSLSLGIRIEFEYRMVQKNGKPSKLQRGNKHWAWRYCPFCGEKLQSPNVEGLGDKVQS